MPTLSSAKLYGVLHSHIEQVWPTVAPMIERVLPHTDGKYLACDIRDLLLSRDMQLWVAVDEDILSCAVTQIHTWPRKKVATIVMCAGDDMGHWLHMHDFLASWALENGCQAIEIYGRPGWEKVLPSYKKIHVVLRRELTH